MKALFDEDFAELYMEGCTFLLTKLFMQTQVDVWTNKPLRTKLKQKKSAKWYRTGNPESKDIMT